MPTYDYECTACDHAFELMQPITAKPIKKCPKCGGQVRRLIGRGAGIIFKGSGFYETDYKRKSSGSSSSSSSFSSTGDSCSSCPAKKDKSCDGKAPDKSS